MARCKYCGKGAGLLKDAHAACEQQHATDVVLQQRILADLLDGVLPVGIFAGTSLPFSFMPSEVLLWPFFNVEYLEDKTVRQYVGGSRGVSLRVMRGVSFRLGGYRGHTVESAATESVGFGTMAITTRHIYFHGRKSMRIPFEKIVAIQGYTDGVGITRDAAYAREQTFMHMDAYFMEKLLRTAIDLRNGIQPSALAISSASPSTAYSLGRLAARLRKPILVALIVFGLWYWLKNANKPVQRTTEQAVAAAEAAEVEINQVWRSMSKEKRHKLLSEQRQFNARKDESCKQAEQDAGGGDAGLRAKSDCLTLRYTQRTIELRQYAK